MYTNSLQNYPVLYNEATLDGFIDKYLKDSNQLHSERLPAIKALVSSIKGVKDLEAKITSLEKSIESLGSLKASLEKDIKEKTDYFSGLDRAHELSLQGISDVYRQEHSKLQDLVSQEKAKLEVHQQSVKDTKVEHQKYIDLIAEVKARFKV
jgi:DNA mismatch repair ATPase MutS